MTYYPILKISNAEMGALENLKSETKELIVPILESKVISEIKVDQWWTTFRTLGQYLKNKIGEMKFIYDFSSAFEKIGEFHELKDENGFDLVQHCIKKMEEARLNYVPCLHFDSPQWIIDSVLQSTSDEVAIRIRCHDFNSPMEDLIRERVTEKIINLAPHKKFSIIIDFNNSPISYNRIETSLQNFSKINYNILVLALTACPEDANKALPNTFSLICARDDLKTYYQLRKEFPHLQFGDYTVRLKSDFEGTDINYYNTYLKLFYSSEDDYYIAKSTLLDRNGIESFIGLCQEIIESDLYKGPDFSHGDKAIKDCAERVLAITNHSKPIEFGINHHIELTARQL